MTSFKEELEADKSVLWVSEFVEDRLFFVTYVKNIPRSTTDIFYFTTVDSLPYQYDDYRCRRKYYDALYLSSITRSFDRIKFYLQSPKLASKTLVHFALCNRSRVFAAFLMGVYAMAQMHKSPTEAFDMVSYPSFEEALIFRCPLTDYPRLAMMSLHRPFTIQLMDCLNTLHKALCCGLVDFDDFDDNAFDKIASKRRDGSSWIVPDKLLVIRSPIDNPVRLRYHYQTPQFYLDYFKDNNVNTIIRTAGQKYTPEKFTNAGVSYFELEYTSIRPSSECVAQFFHIMENSSGAVALHCQKGLEHSGILVALYLMKHYRMTALEAVIWIHFCRPIRVIRQSYTWLKKHEDWFLDAGDNFRIQKYGDADRLPQHKYGIHSYKAKISKSKGLSVLTAISRVFKRTST